MANAWLDKTSRPVTTIAVVGPKGEKVITAIVDTGFDGFLSAPSNELHEIGLPDSTVVTSTAVLADNRTISVRLCLATIRMDGGEQFGLSIIAPSKSEAVVGMRFLLAFHKKLIVDVTNGYVELAASDYLSHGKERMIP
jgi:predicted aspartyl protease